ncbi:MAG: GNAT family N-acetyltransferase [Ignavibacteria bacterium]|jgi:ribosomal protein S18 acetylase RimI-like enzyme
MIEYKISKSKQDFADAKDLFVEYANSLNFELCFQKFDEEISNLPEQYSEPTGCIILCYEDKKPIGCVGLRKFGEDICEMKRLYLRKEARGKGTGRMLAEKVIAKAKEFGYKKIQLDTIETMKEAIALYKSMRFKEISPYRFNPVKGVIYMELELSATADTKNVE